MSVFGAVVLAAVVSGLPETKAETAYVFVVPGYLFSGAGSTRAHGAEVSVHGFHPKVPFGLGVFGQLQRVDGDHNRWAGGVQVTYSVVGVELGYAHVDGGTGPSLTSDGPSTAAFSQTSGVQVTPFLSLGFLAFGLRWTLPITQGPSPSWGAERAWTVAVKLPLQVSGRSIWETVGQSWSAWK